MSINMTHVGDCRDILALLQYRGVRAQTCVTSPPYFGLRDYGMAGQIGLEQTPDAYVSKMVEVFRYVRDVLTDDGTLWLNLGDSYSSGVSSGVGQKQLLGIPWRVAFALQDDGWILRSDIIWAKPNPMPESVTDRPTKAHEYLFLFAKQLKYYYDADAIKEPSVQSADKQKRGGALTTRGTQGYSNASGAHAQRDCSGGYGTDGFRNSRSVWTIPSKPFRGAHFATFPPGLVRPCILAGSRPGDVVLDPFMGSGTVAQVAKENGRNYVGCELNPEYVSLHRMRGL